MSPLHHEDTATEDRKLALPHELLSQTSLNWKLLIKQCDRLWQALVRSVQTRQEPQVTQLRDRQGHSYFKIYDPLTEQHHYVDSEQEARIWLEQSRY
ncbi:hypothetical protein IFO70_37090 [Phormidium tenue FACHB-886]|nr:hypothetical protein [Phormidium tenue FACHB-886]